MRKEKPTPQTQKRINAWSAICQKDQQKLYDVRLSVMKMNPFGLLN